MADSKLLNTSTSASPPPNCAICLGSCSNKCFSDTCMHQFCFSCLLQWSKIKAECPLCKQPFKSIIHNVKSNEEYEEHIVEQPRPVHLMDNDQFHLILPPGPPPPSRHHRFHFRTTFTVNTHGENAIQRMLMSHSLTNGITISNYLPHSRYSPRPRRRPRCTTTNFRRTIYDSNLWASIQSDPQSMSMRYREITPEYFRANPPSRTRLVPWLNRELNALLRENTQEVMEVVDTIMDYLLRYHICSRPFRNLLRSYLGTRTDHFVHEFYNFMRSPYDMIGYDRNVNYYERPTTPTPFVDISEDDSSDVMIIEENPEVIEVHSSDSDDDVIVTSSFVPKPRVLQEGSTSKRSRRVSVSSSSSNEEQQREEEKKKKRKRKRSRHEERRLSILQDDSDDDNSSSSLFDDVPLAKYMRIKASIDKKMKESRASALAKSKDRSKERKRERRESKDMHKKTKIAESSISSPKAHCSRYERRDSSSSSISSFSSSDAPEPRNRGNLSIPSCSSGPNRTMPRLSIPKLEIDTENRRSTSPSYFTDRVFENYPSVLRSCSTSPGEGPSSRPSLYEPSDFHPVVDSRDSSASEPPILEPEVPSVAYDCRGRDSVNNISDKSKGPATIHRRHHVNGMGHLHLDAVASSSSSSPSVYVPRPVTDVPDTYYYSRNSLYNSEEVNDRKSPDLIDLSVTSRIRHEKPLILSCVPPEIRNRCKPAPSRFYNPCTAAAMRSNNGQLPNAVTPSTSYTPYNYDSVPGSEFKSEPSYSEYQSEGSTKYWTDLSTQSNKSRVNFIDYAYQNQLPRKSVIRNSRESSVPPQNEIISPRWSSSNSPSYPCYTGNWSENSD